MGKIAEIDWCMNLMYFFNDIVPNLMVGTHVGRSIGRQSVKKI